MINKKVSNKTIKVEQISGVNCDWCKGPLFSKNKKEKKLIASLTLSAVSLDQMNNLDNIITDDVRHESSEFCHSCYDKLLDFMISNGAKVPSFFLDTTGMDDEEVNFDDGKH